MAFDSANRTGRTVVGLFHDRSDAERAINELKDAGFTREQIGIAIKDRGEQRDLAETTDTSQAGKGAAAGAVSGGLVGGVIGLLGSLLIPGLGPIVVGGVLESVLVGAGAGAATGGIIGGLVGMGVSEEDAKHFDTGFREGGTLVTVEAGTRVDEAERILSMANADLGPAWSARAAGASGGLETGFAGRREQSTMETGDRIELREEQLDVNTRAVQKGEVRVRKDIVEEQQTVDVPVTREEIVIERHAAEGRPAAEGTVGSEDEIRVPLMEEEVEVRKRPVVREEATVSKRRVTDTERVNETVRREELEVGGDVGSVSGAKSRRGSSYSGSERRRRNDPQYAGPERRLVGV
jgi:uncharacterized protein (TIGR02271 family)